MPKSQYVSNFTSSVNQKNVYGGKNKSQNVSNFKTFANLIYVLCCKTKFQSVSNFRTFANLKLEVQFQFSGKFPASCHQQQTGKVIISSQECLTINNIKRIRRNVTKYIFLSLWSKFSNFDNGICNSNIHFEI